MTNPIGEIPRIIPPMNPELRSSALVRRMKANLEMLGDELQRVTEPNPRTDSIGIWHRNFRTQVYERNAQPAMVLYKFVDLLREILTDPLLSVNGIPDPMIRPLDELRALLKEAMDDPIIIDHMDTDRVGAWILFQWLNTPITQPAPPPPPLDPIEEMLNQIMAEEQRRQDERAARATEGLRELREEIEATMNVNMANISERARGIAQEHAEQIQEIAQTDQERAEAILIVIDHHAKELDELEKKNKALQAQINALDAGVDQAAREELILQGEIDKTREAIKKRDSFGKELCTFAAVVAIAVVLKMNGVPVSTNGKGIGINFFG